MKKTLLSIIAVSGLLLACGGGPSNAEYETAANEVCSCMDEKTAKNEVNESSIDMTDLDFALCALGVATKVDPFSDEMGSAIKSKCPKYSDAHKEYQKSKTK